MFCEGSLCMLLGSGLGLLESGRYFRHFVLGAVCECRWMVVFKDNFSLSNFLMWEILGGRYVKGLSMSRLYCWLDFAMVVVSGLIVENFVSHSVLIYVETRRV